MQMMPIKSIKGVRQFYIYKDAEVVVFKDKVCIRDKELDANDEEDYCVDHGVLTKLIYNDPTETEYVFVNDHFEEFRTKYKHVNHFSPNAYYSCEDDEDGGEKYCISDHGEEYSFTTREQVRAYIAKYDTKSSILMIPLWDDKTLVFYTKTGQRLWEYKEKEEKLKLSGKCISVVDDVVVVISLYGARPQKIQGFNIRTGKRLWVIQSDAKYESDTFFIGEDKMLYGCRGYMIIPGIGITMLNPITGKLDVILINTDEEFDFMPNEVTMQGRKLYFVNHRKGNEIGVIDVDKKELVERVPLNIKKKVTIGAPVVTDDKVYVFIRDLKELRVFEK